MNAFCMYPKSKIAKFFGTIGHPKVGGLLNQRCAYGCVCSGCPSNHKCVQLVFKTPLHHYINIQSCFYAIIHISPAILGIFSNSSHSTVAVALLCSWCCTGHLRSQIRFSETVARAVVLASRQPFAGCAGFVSRPIRTQMLKIPASHLPHAPVGRSRPATLSWDCQTFRLQNGCKKTFVSLDPQKTFCEEMDAKNR